MSDHKHSELSELALAPLMLNTKLYLSLHSVFSSVLFLNPSTVSLHTFLNTSFLLFNVHINSGQFPQISCICSILISFIFKLNFSKYSILHLASFHFWYRHSNLFPMLESLYTFFLSFMWFHFFTTLKRKYCQ